MKQRIVKSKFDFPKVEQQSSLKRLCYIKKEQGKAQEEKEEQDDGEQQTTSPTESSSVKNYLVA